MSFEDKLKNQIGSTESGKPVLADGAEGYSKDYTQEDHRDASKVQAKESAEAQVKQRNSMLGRKKFNHRLLSALSDKQARAKEQQDYHDEQADVQKGGPGSGRKPGQYKHADVLESTKEHSNTAHQYGNAAEHYVGGTLRGGQEHDGHFHFTSKEGYRKVKLAKAEKPFHGYNPKKHSKEGGLSDKGREKMNRETGSNLKRPVTTANPKSDEAKGRRKSFCARMSGVKGPTSKDGKLTPKGAALKRWKCSKSFAERVDDLQKASGEGSRGGKVTGHTKSGKPIYGDKKDPKGKNPIDDFKGQIPGAGVGARADAMAERIKASKEKPRTLTLRDLKPAHYTDSPNLKKYRALLNFAQDKIMGHFTYDPKADKIMMISKEAPEILKEAMAGGKKDKA